MAIALKIFISIALGLCWQILSGDISMSCILAVFTFVVLIIKPKKDRYYQDGDEFKQKVKEKNEQKIFLEEERILEKKQNQEKQNQAKSK